MFLLNQTIFTFSCWNISGEVTDSALANVSRAIQLDIPGEMLKRHRSAPNVWCFSNNDINLNDYDHQFCSAVNVYVYS